MADIWDSATRSRVMARIRGKNTKPELLVRRFLYANGFRYRLHVRTLPGTPDLVLPAYKTVVFVHGCFWHGHEGCKEYRLPATNPVFWGDKISRNRARDVQHIAQLKAMGWHVAVVWECSLKGQAGRARLVDLLRELTDRLPVFQAERLAAKAASASDEDA